MTKDRTSPNIPDHELIYQLEGRPTFTTAFPLGLQHVLCMFTSNLAPILIVAAACGLSTAQTVIMIQSAMFVSGLTTFVQLYPIKLGKFQIGANLPIVMGTSFSFVPTMTSLAAASLAAGLSPSQALGAILGGCMVASMVEVFMGAFYKHISRFFPPLVVGAMLIAVGLNLLGVGVDYLAGGVGSSDYGSVQNMALGLGVFAIVILLQHFGKGLVKNSAILIGLVIGYIISAFMGMVDFTTLQDYGLFSLPLPFQFELSFPIQPIISFAILFVASGLETIGSVNGITIAGFDRTASDQEVSGGIIADAVGSATAAMFNALPNTAFGQNAGIIAMTKIVNKWCIAMGAFVLIIAGFFPKLGALLSTIPSAVLGGALMTVFGTIMINGMKMVAKAGFTERNLLILSITLALGVGLTGKPEAIAHLPSALQFVFSDSVTATCIVAIIANLLFPARTAQEKELDEKALKDMD